MLLSDKNYYDIIHLGLWWLSKKRDGDRAVPRSLSPLLYTLREIELINETQRRAAMRDRRLLQRLGRKIHIVQSIPGDSRADTLLDDIEPGFKTLTLVLPPFEEFDGTRVLRKYGYRFQLTKAGTNYAAKKAGPYANIVTEEDFVAGWETMRERVGNIMRATVGRQQSKVIEMEPRVGGESNDDVSPDEVED